MTYEEESSNWSHIFQECSACFKFWVWYRGWGKVRILCQGCQCFWHSVSMLQLLFVPSAYNRQRPQGRETSPALLSDDHSWHSPDFSQVAAPTTAEAFQCCGQMEDASCDVFTHVGWCRHGEKITRFFSAKNGSPWVWLGTSRFGWVWNSIRWTWSSKFLTASFN